MIHLKFTEAEVRHLLSHLGHNDLDLCNSWYYGKKSDFEKRHRSLEVRLETSLIPRVAKKERRIELTSGYGFEEGDL